MTIPNFKGAPEPNTEMMRRAEDVVETKVKIVDRTVGITFLIFGIAFLYKLVEVLKAHTTYNDFYTPAGTGEILEAILYGLAAMALALGVNVKRLIKGFIS